MARVIKAGGDHARGESARTPRHPTTRMGQNGRPVIEKAVFRAQQEAADKRAAAEKERERIVVEGRQKAQRAREEAQVGGAAEAFAEAAKEAILAFRHRAERYAEAASDMEVLALAVVKKILGHPPALSDEQIKEVLHAGLARLRARRRLRIQIPQSRREELKKERAALIRALEKEPDLLLEAQGDVSPGFARVVTEAGAALCAEAAALELLADALEVDESETSSPDPMPEAPVADAIEAPSADSEAAAEKSVETVEQAPRSNIRKTQNAVRPLAARPVGRAAKPLAPIQRHDNSVHPAAAQEGSRRVRPLAPAAPPAGERARVLSATDPKPAPRRVRPLSAGPSGPSAQKSAEGTEEPKDVSFLEEEAYADEDLDLFADEVVAD